MKRLCSSCRSVKIWRFVAGRVPSLISVALLLVLLTFAACGSGGDPVNDGVDDRDVAWDGLAVPDAVHGDAGDSGPGDVSGDAVNDLPPEVIVPDVKGDIADVADAIDVGDPDVLDVPDVQGFDVDPDGSGDTVDLDEGQQVDTVGDSSGSTCSGPCEFGVDVDSCDFGYLICGCDEDNQWREYDCREVCIEDDLLGGECVFQAGWMVCDCVSDCEDLDALERDCDWGLYTECTCAPEDPCGWAENGICDSGCLTQVSEYFEEFMDCRCLGACEPESFWGFCDNDRDLCFCDVEGSQDYVSCPDYCQALGMTTGKTEYCTYDFVEYLGDYEFMATCDCVK